MGSGNALVVNTGGNTEFGKISLELEELNTGDIPIRSKVKAIGNYLIGGMLVVFTILVVYRGINILNLIANQDPRLKTPIDLIGFIIFELSTIIITAMSTVPINIPLLASPCDDCCSGLLFIAHTPCKVSFTHIVKHP